MSGFGSGFGAAAGKSVAAWVRCLSCERCDSR